MQGSALTKLHFHYAPQGSREKSREMIAVMHVQYALHLYIFQCKLQILF